MLTERGDMGIINFVRWTTQNESERKEGMERYRSGHNEAVLKTVCPQGRVGSNPTLSAQHFEREDGNQIAIIASTNLEKYPSGRRGSPGKGVGR